MAITKGNNQKNLPQRVVRKGRLTEGEMRKEAKIFVKRYGEVIKKLSHE